MEINFVLTFLDPEAFIMYIIGNFPVFLYNLLIYSAIWQYKSDLKFSRLMLISSLIALSVSLAFLFIPQVEARNISEEEMYNLGIYFTFLSLITSIPALFIPALSLLIFGWANKGQYKIYLFLAGVFAFLYNIYSFIFNTYRRFLDYNSYPTIMILFGFLIILSYGIIITSYVFLLLHGVFNKQVQFRNTAITMIGAYVFVLFISPFIYNFIFTIFRGN